MELRQLRYFQAAAEELHFQRAARRVNLSQPALSHQIKRLEEEVGVILIDRSRNHAALTPAGESFLVRAREILATCEAALREAREIGGAEPEVLRIGYVEFLNLGVVARSIAAFRAGDPTRQVEQRDLHSAEAYAALKEREIDIGFGILPVTHPTLKFRKVAEGWWGLIAPEGHAWAERESIPLAELDKAPLILFDRTLNPPLYDAWMARFADAGIAPNIVFTTKQVQTALTMAQDGSGFFLVASYIVEPLPAGFRLLRLTGFNNEIAIGAAWHEDNKTRLLADYLALLRAQL